MLLIGAVLLGAFIWFFEHEGETSQQKQQRIRTVFAIYPESIHSIQMERNGVEFECTKASGIWRLTRPVDAPVNTGLVEKMIATMTRAERGELLSADTVRERGLSPADYGFDEPRARITFQNSHGTFTWLIGRDAPLGKMLYVMAEGDGTIIAAPSTLLHLIPEDPSWIRDHTLFHNKATAVRGIDLRRPGGFLQLRHPEQNGWIMQQPHKGRADIRSVHALIEKIYSVRIGKFIIDEKVDLTVYGLEEPAFELTLFTQDEQTQTLRIGKSNPDQPDTYYAKWADRDSVFTIPGEWVKLLEIKKDQLRNRNILGIPADHITRLQIIRGETQIDLIQSNETWQITRPARWDTEPFPVKMLLQTLAEATVLNFVDDPSTDQLQLMTDAPWTIRFTENNRPHTLRISSINANGLRLVQRDEETSFYATLPHIVDEGFSDPLFFRSRTLLQINPIQIEKITQQTGGSNLCVQRVENRFKPADRTQQTEAGAVSELLTALADLHTTDYIAFNPDSLDPYGLSTPSFRLMVTHNSSNTLGRVILLGGTAEGGRFAMLQGQNIVFILPEKTVQTLTRKVTTPLEKQTEELERP